MTILTLKKQTEPIFDELGKMICDLKGFLNEEANPNSKEWSKNLSAVIDFQDDDGSFTLLDCDKIPSEARVDFKHIPTYICSAILMKAYLTNPEAFTLEEKSALERGLEASCARNLRGHGYDAFRGQIEALNIFIEAGLNEFLDIHPDLCQKFSEMIRNIISRFQEMEEKEEFTGPWGESYEEDIRKINGYFSQRKVFVYGTLMKGETNHHYLENSKFLAKTTIKGYDMYSVGWYPAIVAGDGLIVGELYQVAKEDMQSIDNLEGEGSLYIKRCESISDANGNKTRAFVYVYLGDVSGLEKIPAWNQEYVWYVSYGSNMLKERFLCYIQGGSYKESRDYTPCNDTTPPLAFRTVEIPYDMYFGQESRTWNGGGVSFLDTTKKGKALGVAYLITREQFRHVAREENTGRDPHPGWGWYEDIIELGATDGFEKITITNNNPQIHNEPIQKYWNTLFMGIKQNWPEMSDEEIEDYLENCIRQS